MKTFMESSLEKEKSIFIKRRKPFIALIISLVIPGLGQIYNGQLIKGILFYGLFYLIPIIFGLTRGITFFYGLVLFIIIEILFTIYIILDSIKNARRQKDYVFKRYNVWYIYILIPIGMISINHFVDIKSMLKSDTFKITTSSNEPTFSIGDWIACDKNIYNKKQPMYGDIIVCKSHDGYNYISRIVGLPNDKIDINDTLLAINNKPNKLLFIKKTNLSNTPVVEFEEELPNYRKHKLYRNLQPFDSTKSNLKSIIVPADCYYILRDYRYEVMKNSPSTGLIKKVDIIGQVVYSYWANTIERININYRNR